MPQNKFYTNREQRALSFFQEHNTQSQIDATVQNYYHDPKRYSKPYRKERSVAKPWFNNGELATATDFVKNRQKSFGRASVGQTSNTLYKPHYGSFEYKPSLDSKEKFLNTIQTSQHRAGVPDFGP